MKRKPIQLEDLFRLRAVGRPALSPDSQRVAFELKRFDAAENKNFTQLMLVEVDSGETRALTSGPRNDTQPRWSPDGTRLAYISDRDKGACLFVMPMGGGEPQRLTEPDGFVSDLAWSPDGARIAYVWQAMSARERLERDGKQEELRKQPQYKHITRLFHKLDGAGWWNGEYAHVWILDLKSGKRRQLTDGEFDHREPRFSPDGKCVSFVANRLENPDLNLENADIFSVRLSGGTVQKITQGFGACAGHSWSPDGKTIAFVGNLHKRGESWKHLERVWLVAASGGKPRELVTQIDNNCRNLTLGDVATAGFAVDAPIWAADSSRIYFLVSERGATRLYSQSLAHGDLRCEVNGDINICFMQRTAADGPIALTLGAASDPADIYLTETLWRQHSDQKSSGWKPVARSHAEMPKRLTHVNADVLDSLELPAPEEIVVRSGNVNVHAWVYKPPGFDAKRKYPAILEMHGGPHTQVGHAFFHEKFLFAARGYIVVSGNPRGSVGYGQAFTQAIHADWGNRDYQDVMKIADWIFAQKFVDKRRVGLTGGSYGGYMTAWIVGHTDRFRAAVAQRGVYNIESEMGTSDFGVDFSFELGALPWENPAHLRKMSPLTYAPKIKTPLLIEHEEQDLRCPIEQAEQLYITLRALGREVELVRFEGESHGLCRSGRPQNRAERLRRILGWFERHMR